MAQTDSQRVFRQTEKKQERGPALHFWPPGVLLILSNLLPLHFISLLFLKWIPKPKRGIRLLPRRKGKRLCCYGSVYSELSKLGAYLYFKTNRDHVNNSRCCERRVGFITGGPMWGQKSQSLPVEEVGWAAWPLCYSPGWEHSVVPSSVGWIHMPLRYPSPNFLVGPRRYFQNCVGNSSARKTSNCFEGAGRRLIFANMIGGIYLPPPTRHLLNISI